MYLQSCEEHFCDSPVSLIHQILIYRSTIEIMFLGVLTLLQMSANPLQQPVDLCNP